MMGKFLLRLDIWGRLSFGLILVYLSVSLFGPHIAPYNPKAYAGDPLQRPDQQHWLGTNDVGQDILSQVLWGTRASIFTGILVSTLATLLSTCIALIAGVYGGTLDHILMRLVDLFLSVPRLVFIIVLASYAGSSMSSIIFVLVLFSWAKGARILRAHVLTLKGQPHIEAAQLFGASRLYIISQHLLPESLPIIIYKFVRTASFAIMTEAGLAFLGIGDPNIESWGRMFHDIQSFSGIYYTNAWIWWLLPPVFCLTALLSALLIFGYALEEAINPQMRAIPDQSV